MLTLHVLYCMYVCDVVDVTGIIPLFVYSQSSWPIVRTERDDSLLLSTTAIIL